jgi:hypothetical protein
VPCPDEQPANHTPALEVLEINSPDLVQELTERAPFQVWEHILPDMRVLCKMLFLLLCGIGGGVTGYFLSSFLLR